MQNIHKMATLLHQWMPRLYGWILTRLAVLSFSSRCTQARTCRRVTRCVPTAVTFVETIDAIVTRWTSCVTKHRVLQQIMWVSLQKLWRKMRYLETDGFVLNLTLKYSSTNTNNILVILFVSAPRRWVMRQRTRAHLKTGRRNRVRKSNFQTETETNAFRPAVDAKPLINKWPRDQTSTRHVRSFFFTCLVRIALPCNQVCRCIDPWLDHKTTRTRSRTSTGKTDRAFQADKLHDETAKQNQHKLDQKSSRHAKKVKIFLHVWIRYTAPARRQPDVDIVWWVLWRLQSASDWKLCWWAVSRIPQRFFSNTRRTRVAAWLYNTTLTLWQVQYRQR